jgi:hypothetical protein
MKRNVMLISALMIALVAVPAVFAGGNQEAEGDYPAQLETALENNGFSEAEAQDIAAATRDLDWEDGQEADPEIVARALALAEQEGEELSPEEHAELGLELARNAVRLAAEEGHDQSVVAKATLEAVRKMLGQIEDWKNGDGSENLGETVRRTVSSAARKAARQQAEKQTKSGETGGTPETPAGDKADSGSSNY